MLRVQRSRKQASVLGLLVMTVFSVLLLVTCRMKFGESLPLSAAPWFVQTEKISASSQAAGVMTDRKTQAVWEEVQSNSHFMDLSLMVFGGSKEQNYKDIKKGGRGKTTCEKMGTEVSLRSSRQQYLTPALLDAGAMVLQNERYNRYINESDKVHKPKIERSKRFIQFAGATVWLEQHQVHIMASRLMYSPSGKLNKATTSFLFMQLFDKEWRELENKTLEISFEQKDSQGQMHEVKRQLTFPYVSDIDFTVNYHKGNKKYYGPEDPRIILRRSSLGFEEPLVVFNMKTKSLKRSMHMYKPFSEEMTALRLDISSKIKTQKNWVPFINDLSNDTIFFVYTLNPLVVASCDVHSAICNYSQKDDSFTGAVGPLRGGTQFVQLPLSKLTKRAIFGANRSVFIGWARAHLNNCGCGSAMYRPNLVVLLQDYHACNNSYTYSIPEVSEYTDFGMEVRTWEDAKDPCQGRSVLIPNSIIDWRVSSHINTINTQIEKLKHPLHDKHIKVDGISKTLKDKLHANSNDCENTDNLEHQKIHQRQGSSAVSSKTWASLFSGSSHFEDLMSLSLSSADSDISVIYVSGLMNAVLSLPSLYAENASHRRNEPSITDAQPQSTAATDAHTPSLADKVRSWWSRRLAPGSPSPVRGSYFAHKPPSNLMCAIEASRSYCRAYGQRVSRDHEDIQP
ncbi:Piso0_000218 [Millerozyma farinosa CBS 7064]|uniref:Piso0_000218 protein n=1 Tax=Pichia sorbitophila (strain ATCC MYA-4447 / BCRC 22081 / CBS 7064 / NBRC 10061 / NRRL Y-12695) TaxID=559304 RepID=G8YTE3_PICSO|nr:Piso0_000218 [Millerozyma farinosa CBS 7064]